MTGERTRTGRTYWTSWQGLLLLASLASSAIAWWLIAWPVATLSNIPSHPGHFALTFLHMAGGTGMLFLGALNLYLASNNIAFWLHRKTGMAYLAFGAIGAGSALVVTLTRAHKDAADPLLTNLSVSLAMLSLAWLAFAALGLRAARNRRFDSHRDWMIRSYVLVWAFVFCRLGSRVPALGGLGEGEAFAWLSWVGPMILCELALQWDDGARKQPRLPPARPTAEV